MKYEYIFSIVKKMRREIMLQPRDVFKINEFRNMSYRLSLLNEIEMYLDMAERNSPFRENGISYLEHLQKIFDDKSCVIGSEDKKLLFTVYYETVSDILNILYTMEIWHSEKL